MSAIADENAANAQLQSEMQTEGQKDVKNMDYHRQMLQAKLANGGYAVPLLPPLDSLLTSATVPTTPTSPHPTTSCLLARRS